MVALSVSTGLVLAILLVFLPIVPADESHLTGALLWAFGVGWAMVAILSLRFTDQPQRWAVGPAVFMAVAGLVALSGSTGLRSLVGWVWPPVLFGLAVWMFGRIRRQLPSRVGRWILYPVLAVLIVAAVGGGVETVSEARDAATIPMPGQRVDVDGHRMHLHCTGSGSPTVILEPGGGGASSDFGWVAPAVARDTRVCVYDRAGRGWSDAAAGPQDATRIAADLHTLLERAHVPGPFVLAGHSFGGLYVLTFAALHPDQSAGLVLLDATAPVPGPVDAPTDQGSYDPLQRATALAAASGHLGVGRLIARASYNTLPAPYRGEAKANSSTAGYLTSWFEEFLGQASTSMREAALLTSFDTKPLIVVTADEGITDQQWQSKQDRMASLSSNSLHRHAAATHESLIYDRADSTAAIRAIHDVVMAVRTSEPLR